MLASKEYALRSLRAARLLARVASLLLELGAEAVVVPVCELELDAARSELLVAVRARTPIGDDGQAGQQIRADSVRDRRAIVERCPRKRASDVGPARVVARELLDPARLRPADVGPAAAQRLEGRVDVEIPAEESGLPPRVPRRQVRRDHPVGVVEAVAVHVEVDSPPRERDTVDPDRPADAHRVQLPVGVGEPLGEAVVHELELRTVAVQEVHDRALTGHVEPATALGSAVLSSRRASLGCRRRGRRARGPRRGRCRGCRIPSGGRRGRRRCRARVR